MEIFIYVILGYFLLVSVGLRLVVPHLGFKKTKIPENIPEDLKVKISELSSQSSTNKKFLELSYEFLTKKYQGSRIKTITQFWKAFGSVFNKQSGFLPCNMQNYLLRIMLIESGRFKETDIQLKITTLNLFIHQYMRINVDGTYVNVDPWSSFLGLHIGDKSSIVC